jgi:hypothetical protein
MKCHGKEAIKVLSTLISNLQPDNHTIVLAIDANQTSQECYSNSSVKKTFYRVASYGTWYG